MTWTNEQIKIIHNPSKKILVKAGAGTGKTAILIERVIQLLKKDSNLNINEIAIITFTNKATEEIQTRLKSTLYREWRLEKDPKKRNRLRSQLEALNSSQISTIHKFCQSILEEIGPFFNHEIAYSPAYQVSSTRLLDSIDSTIESWFEEKEPEKIKHFDIMPVHVFKNLVVKLYSGIRSKGLNITQIMDKTKESALMESSPIIRELKNEIAEVLEKLKKNHMNFKHGRIDVDDLLEYCAQILKERPDLLERVQKRFKHIIVDEFQDTSLYQSEIIMNICNNNKSAPSLFVVGDSKQSIYGFRGADLNAYQEIEKWIRREGTVLELQTNWRSKPEVVYFVNYIFQNLKSSSEYEFKHESLKPSKNKDNIDLTKAYKWIFGKKEEHGRLVGKFLNDELAKGKKLDDYVVLVRNNYQLPLIEKGLRENNIENYIIIGSGAFYNQPEIVDTFKVLNFLLNPMERFYYKEACNTLFFMKDENMLNLFIDKVEKERLIYEYTPAQLLDFLFKETNVERRFSTLQIANLNKLKEKTRETFINEHITLRQFLSWLQTMIISKKDEPLASGHSTKEKVQVMTIHKSKGLEFKNVILPFLNEELSKTILYPEIIVNHNSLSVELNYSKKYSVTKESITSQGYEEAINHMHFDIFSEELRVLYVALTRAKSKLILLGDKDNKNKQNYQSWITGD